MGLVELLIALTMLNVALLVLVSSFASGAISMKRASRVATATALANTQLEQYRALRWSSIALDANSVTQAMADSTYKNDAACGGSCTQVTTTCTTPLAAECIAKQTKPGADSASYRVDTYVISTAVPSGRNVKLVSVVVRDATTNRQLARQQSTFDQATG